MFPGLAFMAAKHFIYPPPIASPTHIVWFIFLGGNKNLFIHGRARLFFYGGAWMGAAPVNRVATAFCCHPIPAGCFA